MSPARPSVVGLALPPVEMEGEGAVAGSGGRAERLTPAWCARVGLVVAPNTGAEISVPPPRPSESEARGCAAGCGRPRSVVLYATTLLEAPLISPLLRSSEGDSISVFFFANGKENFNISQAEERDKGMK